MDRTTLFWLCLPFIIIGGSIALIVTQIHHENLIYSEVVGKYVVINNDTLQVTSSSSVYKTITLENKQTIDLETFNKYRIE